MEEKRANGEESSNHFFARIESRSSSAPVIFRLISNSENPVSRALTEKLPGRASRSFWDA